MSQPIDTAAASTTPSSRFPQINPKTMPMVNMSAVPNAQPECPRVQPLPVDAMATAYDPGPHEADASIDRLEVTPTRHGTDAMALNVSPLTLGTSGLGRNTEPGSREEEAAVDIAVDLLTSAHAFVDTSNNYSAGRSEAVLGLAIARVGEDAATRVLSKA